MENDLFTVKYQLDESYSKSSDSCWQSTDYFGCLGKRIYIKGLGGPYQKCSGEGSEVNEEPVCFEKGDIKWGTPLLINNSKTNQEVDKFKVYPNPAIDRIFFQNTGSGPFSFELIDIHGRIVFIKAIDTDQPSVLLDENLHGFYLYRITQGNLSITRKLFIY